MVVLAERGKAGRVASSYSKTTDSYAADLSEEHSEESENGSTISESEGSSEDSQVEDYGRDGDPEGDADTRRQGKSSHSPVGPSTEGCTFDLRNLVAVNSHQVSSASMYGPKGSKAAKEGSCIAIPPDNLGVQVDDELLLKKAREGCTQLLRALWELPTERSDAGPMVTLPSHCEINIPRALPPPPPKKETKWEKFAKERGIEVNKKKRSRKVWDEATGTWMFRHGYQKANDDAQNWPIMEVKGNDDPYADPWEKIRDAKKARVEKNTESRMRNQERAGLLTKGTATRVSKSREKARERGKAGGHKDRAGELPSGVPVDLHARQGSKQTSPTNRGKESTVAALLATQRSTASLGKFDKMREGEPERRKSLASMRKRKFDGATDRKVLSSETERGMKLLSSVMNGGGVGREKAKRSGALAKGETAYDYEFNDGLGPGGFRKKKGRAGAGKMKKVTKKRVK